MLHSGWGYRHMQELHFVHHRHANSNFSSRHSTFYLGTTLGNLSRALSRKPRDVLTARNPDEVVFARPDVAAFRTTTCIRALEVVSEAPFDASRATTGVCRSMIFAGAMRPARPRPTTMNIIVSPQDLKIEAEAEALAKSQASLDSTGMASDGRLLARRQLSLRRPDLSLR